MAIIDGKFTCAECGAEFDTQEELIKHNKDTHLIPPQLDVDTR